MLGASKLLLCGFVVNLVDIYTFFSNLPLWNRRPFLFQSNRFIPCAYVVIIVLEEIQEHKIELQVFFTANKKRNL